MVSTKRYLGNTFPVHNKIVVIEDDLCLGTAAPNRLAFIKRVDFDELRAEFVRALVRQAVPFVYSAEHRDEVLEQLSATLGVDNSEAHTELFLRCRDKFRRSQSNGQFCELLLFVVLQHFFQAAPLLRKMRITTDPEHERNGADAVHVWAEGDDVRIFVGEAKAYTIPSGDPLLIGLKDAAKSVLEHHQGLRRELDLYIFEEFIPRELERIAIQFKDGQLNAAVHLVCLVAYDDREDHTGGLPEDVAKARLAVARERGARAGISKPFSVIPAHLKPRISFVLFATSQLDDLVSMFRSQIGVGSGT